MKLIKTVATLAALGWVIHNAYVAGTEDGGGTGTGGDPDDVEPWINRPREDPFAWLDTYDGWDDDVELFPHPSEKFWPTERGAW